MSLLEHDNHYCKNCLYAKTLSFSGDCICEKKGVIVSEDHICKKFTLDPFKITPIKKPKIDFTL